MRAPLPGGFYGIADADASPDVVAFGRALLAAGVRVVQLRMKHRAEALIRPALETLSTDSAKVGAVLILNDHPRLAAEFPNVGVHLGQDDMDPAEARALLPDRVLGWSTHDLDQVRRAADLPIDYVGFGPVFSAAGKHLHDDDDRSPDPATGVAGLREAVAASTVPVVAIGGIDAANRAEVWRARPHAVVAIGALARASDPRTEAAAWVSACRR